MPKVNIASCTFLARDACETFQPDEFFGSTLFYINLLKWVDEATITLRATCMSSRTRITSKRPSVEETADLIGVSRRRAQELVAIVGKWVARDSHPGKFAGRKNGKRGSIAGKKAGNGAPGKNPRS
jgi:hypothetical protein